MIKTQSFAPVGLFARIAAAIVFATSTSFARIGETEAQLKRRYGEPKPIDAPEMTHPRLKSYVYTTGEFRIIVVFLDGLSHFEAFGKEDGVSVNEVEALLKANASRGYWLLEPTESEKWDEEQAAARLGELAASQARKPLIVLPPDRWKLRSRAKWTREDLHMNKLLKDRYHGIAVWDGKRMIISTQELTDFYRAHSTTREAAEEEKKRSKEAAGLKGF